MRTKEDEIKNLEFQITFTKTNLFYLYGETPPDSQKIESVKAKIKELKNKLQDLENS